MSSHSSCITNNVLKATQQWFKKVVLGLNLCPFAHQPARLKRIHFSVSECMHDDELMDALIDEIEQLEALAIDERETTLLLTPYLLKDFYDYQFFLEEANRKLKHHQWQGVFQLASFHPDYCFAGADAEDPSNLTNRSPYPIIHILREASLSAVLEKVENPDDIPQANIEKMNHLSEKEKKTLFDYLPW